MMILEAVDRYFCSHLVSVHLLAQESEEREIVANIEEISPTGACLNLEEPLEPGLSLRIAASDRGRTCWFSGTVVECLEEPLMGHYAQVEFEPGCVWSPDFFEPKHLIRADSVTSTRADATPEKPACCDRGVCPKAVVSRVLEPEFSLTDRVRAVGREVAALCGDLTDGQAVECFGSLFGAGPECGLYKEFKEAHAEQRRLGLAGRRRDLRQHVMTLVQLAGALPVDEAGSCDGAARAPWLTPLIR